MRRSSAVLLSTLLGGCLQGLDEAGLELGYAPEASLRAPVVAPIGVPVVLDASDSIDRDGGALIFVFDFSDGTGLVQSAEPVQEHVFVSEGLYTVRVRVIDATGQESVAAQDVTVRSGVPNRLNYCEKPSDCFIGDACEGGLCYSTGGALD